MGYTPTNTSQQICLLAATQSKTNGGTLRAGQYLNMVLQELCQTYDMGVAKQTFTSTLSPTLVSTTYYPNNTAGSGPYPLPSNYLRVDKDEAIWFLNGVPYPMTAVDMSEFDAQVQQAGMQSYPAIFATDFQTVPPQFVVWPPSSGAYTLMFRYQAQMSDIGSGITQQTWNPGTSSPELSATVPWFPNTNYLITRVAGEMMKESGDERWKEFLGDGPHGAQGILDRYLEMKDDRNDRSRRVKLDSRRFGANYSRLPVTKAVGW